MAVLALLQLGFVFGTKIALRLHHHGSRPQPFPANPVLQLQTSADLKEALDPPQSKNHLIHVSFLPALEPHLRMNSARFWQLNSWVPLQSDVFNEGRIRSTSEQMSCYQALDDCVYFFAQPGRHTKKSIAAVPEP